MVSWGESDSQSKRKAAQSNRLLLHNLWDFGRASLPLQLTLRYVKGRGLRELRLQTEKSLKFQLWLNVKCDLNVPNAHVPRTHGN